MTVDIQAMCQEPTDDYWPDEVAFVFSASRHPTQTDAHAALSEAIVRVNAMTGDWDPKWNLPPQGDRPERSPRGPWARISFPEEDERLLARWLTALVDDLADHGWHGHLEHVPGPDERRPPTPAPGPVVMTLDLGLSGWGSTNMQAPVWRTTPSSVPALIELTRQWLGAAPEPAWLNNDYWCDGSLEEVLSDLRATLSDPQSPEWAEAYSGTEQHSRSANFTMTGRVGLVDRTQGTVQERLFAHRALLSEWAERLDRAAVVGDVGPSYPSERIEWGREMHLRFPPTAMWFNPSVRALDRTRVPDVCVLQLLTSEHLATTNNLAGWRVDEVAPDRFLVEHPDPDAWFIPAPAGEPGTRVEPAVLEQARSDFGTVLISPEDVAR